MRRILIPYVMKVYAPGGVAVIVEALTDNRNRTGAAVRAAFAKHGGNLGATGSVAHMFQHVGEVTYGPDVGSAEKVLEAAIEAGAEDVQSDENGHIITTSFADLGRVSTALEESLGRPRGVKPVWRASVTSDVDEEHAQSVLTLISTLEEDDDVQNVYANFEVSEDVLAKLTAA